MDDALRDPVLEAAAAGDAPSMRVQGTDGVLRASLRVLTSPFGWGRRQLASMHGQSFGGKRDTYEALGYQRVILPTMYRARYKRGGIAARIVEAFPQSCWRGDWDVVEDDDPKTMTPFEQAFADLDKKLQLRQALYNVDVVSGLGRYAVLLIGGPGLLEEPLESMTPEQFLYLQPYYEYDAKIQEYEDDYKNPRFGMPKKYALTRNYAQWPGQLNPPADTAKSVHYSRVIHVAENRLDDPVFGQPRLERCWNLLDDLDKIIGGGAEAFWKRADGGTQFDIDKDMEIDPNPDKVDTAKREMKHMFDEFTNELRKNIITRGVKINRMGSDTADLRGPASAVMDQISATTGIPQRILMGSELGKLASSQDKSNFDDRVQDRRDQHCEPVARMLIDRLIELGALPEPKEYKLGWPVADEMDQNQRITAAGTVADINNKAKQIVVTPTEIRTVYLGLEELTAEQKTEIANVEAANLEKQKQALELQQQAPGPGAAQPQRKPAPPQLRAAMQEQLTEALIEDDFGKAEEILAKAMRQ